MPLLEFYYFRKLLVLHYVFGYNYCVSYSLYQVNGWLKSNIVSDSKLNVKHRCTDRLCKFHQIRSFQSIILNVDCRINILSRILLHAIFIIYKLLAWFTMARSSDFGFFPLFSPIPGSNGFHGRRQQGARGCTCTSLSEKKMHKKLHFFFS